MTIFLRRWEWAALAGILLLAAALRLGAPGISEFKRDEANLARLALDMVKGGDVPLLGLTSSVNVPNPPVSVYLFAVPFAFSNNPILATLYVGLLGVIAVALTWALARRYYGPAAGVVAGLLYAASPWGAIYARKIWAQDLLPPFVAAVVFTGLLGYGEGKRWARWLHWPLLALAVQIHYAALALVPVSVLILWQKAFTTETRRTQRRDTVREKLSKTPFLRVSVGNLFSPGKHSRDTAIALGIAALTFVPGLIGAYQDGWLSLDNLRERVQTNSDHERAITATALDYAWLTVAGTDIHSLAGPEQFRQYLDSIPGVAYSLFKLVPLGAALAAGWLVVRAIRRSPAHRFPDLALTAWLALPVLIFTWEWIELAPHYMIPLMPAAYILCGAGFAALVQATRSSQVRRAVLAGGLALVFGIVMLQAYVFAQLLRFVDDHATPGGFGTPLHYLLDVRAAVLDRDPGDVIVISGQELAPFDEIPAVWGVLLDGVPQVRFVNGTRTTVIPAGPALELIAWSSGLRICPDRDCLDSGAVFNLRPGENPYLLGIAGTGVPDLVTIKPARFANGATLTGYAVQADAVLLAWELGGPVGADYQAFIHVLDADRNRLDQRDRLAWPGRYWHAGDTLLLWFDLTLPPDAAALYAGMYTTDGATFQNVEALDAQGAYLGQGVTISLSGES